MAKKTAGKGKSAPKGNAMLAKLKGFEDNWNDAKENPVGGFTTWEDGKYQVQLVEAELCESQAGRLQVKFGFQNLEVDEEDVHRMYDGLDPEVSEECFAWLQNHIEKMGFEYPAKLSQLPTTLEKMVAANIQLNIQLKTKGDFQNTYLNNLLEE